MDASIIETAIHDCKNSSETLFASSMRKAERVVSQDGGELKAELGHSRYRLGQW